MPIVTLPFNIQNGADPDADQVMANYNAILAVLNGSVDATNVTSGAPSPLGNGASSAGDGPGLSLEDHKHVVQGFETLAADPTTGNFISRTYYDTTNNRERLCIAVDGSGVGTWVTSANLAAGDLPLHASRHAAGGPDALPNGSVSNAMLGRTLTTGVPSGDVTVSANTWTDVVTGVAPTITGTQVATITAQIGVSYVGATNPFNMNWRIIDQGSNVLGMTPNITLQPGNVNGQADSRTFVWPLSFTASPTLKLQVNASAASLTVKKTASTNSSTGPATIMSVVVG